MNTAIQNDIIEGNKIIAEFICSKYRGDDESLWISDAPIRMEFVLKESEWSIYSGYHRFRPDKDWNDLMSAWKKFYDEVVLDQDKNYTDDYGKDLECMEYSLQSANIIGAFKHFVNLLKWYNQNKEHER